MVELFTAGCFGRSPGMVDARSSASLRTSSPRRHGLSEVSVEGQDPGPPVTDYTTAEPRLGRRFTDSCMTARVRNSRTRVCPGRPRSVVGREPPSDRSCGLFSLALMIESGRGLLATASVEPDKRVSTHPALRVSDCHKSVDGMMSPASLRSAGEAGLPGVGV